MDVLRDIEGRLSKMGNRVMPKMKLVEQGGLMLRSILTSSDPWRDQPCGHPQCTTCLGDNPGSCKTRSVVYTNTCMLCKEIGRRTYYVGETGRSLAERNRDHQGDALAKSLKISHMRDHMAREQGDKMEELLDTYRMDIVKATRSALEHQVREAVENGRACDGVLLLNQKEEYTWCLLPKLCMEGP